MTTTTKHTLHISKKEQKRWQVDRSRYINMGYPEDIATQYAYDHMFAYKRKTVNL